jgi:hypothetical protein
VHSPLRFNVSRDRGSGRCQTNRFLITTSGGVVRVVLALLFWNATANAQSGSAPAQQPSEPFGIVDNSFLVEEAFNQDPGVVQNIFTFTRGSASWEAMFTQEWPAPGRRHQLSYSIPLEHDQGTALGDMRVNYRYQALTETAAMPACAPRLTVIFVSDEVHPGLRRRDLGLEFNVAFSKREGDFYFHWNLGATHLQRPSSPAIGVPAQTTPALAGSVVWRTQPLLNLMMEVLTTFPATFGTGEPSARAKVVTLSPGFRRGWNLGDSQVVVGFAAPLTFENGEKRLAFLAYGSYELPFSK